MRAIVLLALSLAACSSDSLPASDGAMSTQDLSVAAGDMSVSKMDLGPRDLSGVTHACKDVNDCRLYSNNCDGCECLALSKNEVNPVCAGMPVSCLVDPCQVETRMLRCDNNMCTLL